jgi:hypothetical protein
VFTQQKIEFEWGFTDQNLTLGFYDMTPDVQNSEQLRPEICLT